MFYSLNMRRWSDSTEQNGGNFEKHKLQRYAYRSRELSPRTNCNSLRNLVLETHTNFPIIDPSHCSIGVGRCVFRRSWLNRCIRLHKHPLQRAFDSCHLARKKLFEENEEMSLSICTLLSHPNSEVLPIAADTVSSTWIWWVCCKESTGSAKDSFEYSDDHTCFSISFVLRTSYLQLHTRTWGTMSTLKICFRLSSSVTSRCYQARHCWRIDRLQVSGFVSSLLAWK